MKASASILTASQPAEKGLLNLFGIALELAKARLTSLVLLTTLVGFYVGTRGNVDFLLMFHTVAATGIVAAGAAALNQLIERDFDRLMPRTKSRPLPSGRLQPSSVLIFGGVCSAGGLIYLATAVNLLTCMLGVITLVLYVAVYTPLKRVTSLNTIIGAIPGALPPLMGWTAARGEVSSEGWSLFAILFFWQLPHFLAIAWIYRDEYAKAGYAMLPVFDPDGHRTGRYTVSHTLGLLPVSLCPFLFKLAGVYYLAGAIALSAAFVWFAIQFSRHLTRGHARQLFFSSIIYLPLLLGLMVFDKM